MTKFLKIAASAVLATLIAMPAVGGNAVLPGNAPASGNAVLSPAGEWQMATGEARVMIELCGDGTQVCATLVWLRNDVATAENMEYLNKQVVNGANRAANNKWRGEVTYQGETLNGALTVLDANTLKLTGCQAIACESMMLTRI